MWYPEFYRPAQHFPMNRGSASVREVCGPSRATSRGSRRPGATLLCRMIRAADRHAR